MFVSPVWLATTKGLAPPALAMRMQFILPPRPGLSKMCGGRRVACVDGHQTCPYTMIMSSDLKYLETELCIMVAHALFET